MEPKHVIALIFGSSKIRGALGVVDPYGNLTVKAIEQEPLVEVIRHGRVSNVRKASEAAKRILDRLCMKEPQMRLTGVYVGLGGRSVALTTTTAESRKPQDVEITESDFNLLIDEARSTVLSDRDIHEVIPRQYFIDGEEKVNPIGTYGMSFEVKFNLISARQILKRNLNHALNTNLKVDVFDYVVTQLAEADFVLTEEERRLGVMLVDFGAETTTVSIYRKNTLQYLSTLPIGSRNITRDLMTLNLLEEEAEQRKRRSDLNSDKLVNGGNDIDHKVQSLIMARAGEIILNIKQQIEYSGLQASDLPKGIVIIGGGARLKGFTDQLRKISGLEVRMGMLPTTIRITDSHIQPNDNIDVISILARIADSATTCMEKIEQPVLIEEPEEEEIKIPTVGNPRKEEVENEKLRKPKTSGFWGTLKDKVVRMMTEEDDDLRDDDDN